MDEKLNKDTKEMVREEMNNPESLVDQFKTCSKEEIKGLIEELNRMIGRKMSGRPKKELDPSVYWKVKNKELSLTEASDKCGLSTRQMQRRVKSYFEKEGTK